VRGWGLGVGVGVRGKSRHALGLGGVGGLGGDTGRVVSRATGLDHPGDTKNNVIAASLQGLVVVPGLIASGGPGGSGGKRGEPRLAEGFDCPACDSRRRCGMNDAPPPDWPAPPPVARGERRERGFLLSILGNIGVFVNLLLRGAMLAGADRRLSDSLDPSAAMAARSASKLLHGLAFLALCNVVFLTGVWMWKKWGVYGYCTLALLVMLVALKVSPVSALGSLAWGAAIAATIGPRWRYFE